MRKVSFFMVLLLMMGTMVMAQGARRGGDKQVDPKIRAERMTERMVKEYSLNDTQKQQLMEANLTLVEKSGLRPERTRRAAADSCARPKGERKAPKMSKEARDKFRQEMQAAHEAYNAQLKSIMTKEQYDGYVAKQAERRKR